MSNVELLSRLGLFFVQNFLDLETCELLCREARLAPSTVSNLSRGEHIVIDESTRRSKRARVSSSLLEPIHDRLDGLRPQVGTHFGVELAGCQDPQLLRYGTGDYFTNHRDRDGEE